MADRAAEKARPVVSAAIRAQNPDLDTAWRTIAWWESTANYWREQAQQGYALRDSLPLPPASTPEEGQR